jgi:hypothetical protein
LATSDSFDPRMPTSSRKASTVDSELVSCDMGLSYKVVNQSGNVIKSDSFQVTGPGFSESAALERAVQILAGCGKISDYASTHSAGPQRLATRCVQRSMRKPRTRRRK